MRILFAGTPATAVTVLEGLLTSGHEVVAVLSREDSPLGRKKILTASPVAEFATLHGHPVIKANRVDAETLSEIAKHKVDLAIVVAYGVILGEQALESVPSGWFNLHFSILPKWRGAAPVQRALQNGDAETGVTLFKIDAGLDTGPIVSTVPTMIQPDETAGDLLSRLALLGVSLLNAELPALYSGTTTLHSQTGEPTLAPKTSRDEAKIDFQQDAKKITDLIRAMNPEPMAWCIYNGEPMRILRARTLPSSDATNAIGVVTSPDERVVVSCGNGTALELLEVQPASRNAMQARDWLNGQSDQVVLS
jgi:methionyl-tRNA formyltransferase